MNFRKSYSPSYFLLGYFLLIFLSNNCFALSLEEYLAQTKEKNLGYVASQTSSKSSSLLSQKAFLLTSPNFFAEAQTGFEKQNQAIAFVRYKKLETQNYSIGIEKDFAFGLSSKFYYNVNRSFYQGLTSTSFTPINYNTNPVLQLNVPLWQGALGSKVQAKRDLTYYGNQADKFNFQSNSANFVVEAEKSYWQLVANQKIVIISQDALLQSEKILNIINKKARMNLDEKSDVLQAMADVESKKLQLQQAKNDARISARNFNQKRYIDSDVVKEKLSEINFDQLEKTQILKTVTNIRADVKAAAASSKAAIASARNEEENSKPKLDLSAQYGFNGLEHNRVDAVSNSLSRVGDEAYVGIKFSVPLAIGLQSDIKSGSRMIASAAKMNYRQKVFDQNNDWQNLVQNLKDYQENLKLSRKIEGLQKSKLENGRYLMKHGRTSTYQLLLFEQDYNQARVSTIKNAHQFLSLIAETKLYQERPELEAANASINNLH